MSKIDTYYNQARRLLNAFFEFLVCKWILFLLFDIIAQVDLSNAGMSETEDYTGNIMRLKKISFFEIKNMNFCLVSFVATAFLFSSCGYF